MTNSEQSVSLPGWNGLLRRNRRGCAVCAEATEVAITLQARAVREDGKGLGKGLANCSISLCNEHALALWEETSALIESRRS